MTLKRFGHIALCLLAGLTGISCDGDRNRSEEHTSELQSQR